MPTSHSHSHRSPRGIVPVARAAFILALAACDGSPSAAGGCARPLRLEAGQAADVQPTPECPLRAEGGAEYVLAFYDARLAMGAQTEPEPYGGIDERFAIIVNDGAGGARTAVAPARAELAAPAPPADFHLSFAPSGPRRVTGISGTGPWSVGDPIPYSRTDCTTGSCPPPPEARVARVFDGWLVLAVAPSLGGDTERVLALFDQAAPLLRQHALPLLQAALSAERPVTTAASGQLVVVFEGDVTGGGGVAFSEVRTEGTATHWIRLETSPDLDLGRMLWLLAHEITHSFQAEFMARDRPLAGGAAQRGAGRWGIEGGATLVDMETLRRAAGLPLQGNLDYGAAPASEVESWLFRNAGARHGVLTSGYYTSAPFLRDLVLRRMDRGDAADAAFREVLRGAVEGWHGVGPEGGRRTGMTERMRTRLPGWEPAEGVLTWTLAAAADDRVAGSAYQDRTWLRTGDWEGRGRGWVPDAVIQAGSGVSERVTGPAGSSGYLLIRSPSGRVELTLTAPETIRWKLLRVS